MPDPKVLSLVELDVPSIAKRIGIGEGIIWKSIQGLEAEKFVRKAGTKRGMKGRLRIIGSFNVHGSYIMRVDDRTHLFVQEFIPDYIKPVYFWGQGQRNVKERLARLKRAK